MLPLVLTTCTYWFFLININKVKIFVAVLALGARKFNFWLYFVSYGLFLKTLLDEAPCAVHADIVLTGIAIEDFVEIPETNRAKVFVDLPLSSVTWPLINALYYFHSYALL
jgi:hypothetical protein